MARFGPYELIERIGHGGMGEVYRAVLKREGAFEKPVVIKRILPSLGDDPEFQRLFNREARIAALLNHQHVVQVYDYGREGDEYFLAMELVDGADLRTLTERLGRPPLPVALAIIRGVARGLDYAHRRRDAEGEPLGLVHRDVSPGNVLLSREGEVKLTDFGLVTGGPTEASDAGTVKGKYAYMSPEQTYGDPVDARSDLFSWGVVTYELLTGHQPFEGPIADVLNGIRDGTYERLPSAPWSPALVDLVHTCLEVHRGDRPESAADVLEALDAIIASVASGDLAAATASWVRKGLEVSAEPTAVEQTEVGDAPIVRAADKAAKEATEAATEAAPGPSDSGAPPEPTGGLSRRRLSRRRSGPVAGWLFLALLVALGLAALATWLAESGSPATPWPASMGVAAPPVADAGRVPGTEAAPTFESDAPSVESEAARASPPDEQSALPTPAQLHVDSDPSGATVLVDGDAAGVTPCELVIDSVGPRQVRVELDGYVSHSETYLARHGVESERFVSLRPLPRLAVSGRPAGASAVVESLGRGGTPTRETCETPCELAVEPGEVVVRVAHDGYIELERTVDVEQSRAIDYALELEPVRLEALWRSRDLDLRGDSRVELGASVRSLAVEVTEVERAFSGSLRGRLQADESGRVRLELSVSTRPWSTISAGWSGPPELGVVETPAELELDGLEAGVWAFELLPEGQGDAEVIELVIRER